MICPVCDSPVDQHGRHDLIACLLAAFDFEEGYWREVENVDGPTRVAVLG